MDKNPEPSEDLQNPEVFLGQIYEGQIFQFHIYVARMQRWASITQIHEMHYTIMQYSLAPDSWKLWVKVQYQVTLSRQHDMLLPGGFL